MLDIFVVALLVSLVDFHTVAEVRAGPGAVAFGAVVVLTMLASMSFDPRLIWDEPRTLASRKCVNHERSRKQSGTGHAAAEARGAHRPALEPVTDLAGAARRRARRHRAGASRLARVRTRHHDPLRHRRRY